MKRREFIAGLGGAAVWPLAARAQQLSAMVIGYLTSGSFWGAETDLKLVGIGKGMSESGYVEGTNLTIEYRWANSDFGRLPELANDLVRRRVTVIVAAEQTSALAAKTATTGIPVVFWTGGDAVEAGLLSSLSRPGGNVTGINSMAVELGPKRLGLLHELLPKALRFGLLVNPNVPNLEGPISRINSVAAALGCSVEIVNSSTNREIDAAFAGLAQKRDRCRSDQSDHVIRQPPCPNQHACSTLYNSDDCLQPRLYRCRWIDELFAKWVRNLSASRRLCWSRPQR
jgi:putative tryptophan/tyrosine transport system substrate-binding protein